MEGERETKVGDSFTIRTLNFRVLVYDIGVRLVFLEKTLEAFLVELELRNVKKIIKNIRKYLEFNKSYLINIIK